MKRTGERLFLPLAATALLLLESCQGEQPPESADQAAREEAAPLSEQQAATQRPPSAQGRAPGARPAAAKFILLDEKVSDTAIKTEIEQHLVVEGLPTKAEIETEITNRYRAALARRGFRYHNPATNIFIYVYGTKEQARSGQGLWIGMIGKGFSDKQEPRVVVNQDRLAALTQPPEDLFGLSEATRKQVYREVAAAEDRGTRDAMARVPESKIIEQITLERELQQKYRAQVARKYNLTQDQLSKIVVEGAKRGWPAPKIGAAD